MTSKEVGNGDMDVTLLSNAELAATIREFGVSPGPIVATTRRLYEKKLLRLLEQGGVAPAAAPAAASSGLNGSLQADRYSDTEENEEEEEEEMAAVWEQTGEAVEKSIQTSFRSPFTTHSSKEHASPGQSQESPSGRQAQTSLRRRAIAHQMTMNLTDNDTTKESTPCGGMRRWSARSSGLDNSGFSTDVEVLSSFSSSGETRRERVAIATPMCVLRMRAQQSEGQERRSAAGATAPIPSPFSLHRATVVQRPSIKLHDHHFTPEWEPWFPTKEDVGLRRDETKRASLSLPHLVVQTKNISPIACSLSKGDSGEGLSVLDTAMIQGKSLEDATATQEHRQTRAGSCTLYEGQGRRSENFADTRLGGVVGDDAHSFVSPSGISATRRRPIRGCAQGNWGDFSPDPAPKLSSLAAFSAPRPAGQGAGPAAAAVGSGPASVVPVWARLVTFVVVCVFVALVYYALEENVQFSGPFGAVAEHDSAVPAAAAAGSEEE